MSDKRGPATQKRAQDIVEALRYWNPVTFPLVAQAADEILALRERLAEAHALLREAHGSGMLWPGMVDRIDAFLKETRHE